MDKKDMDKGMDKMDMKDMDKDDMDMDMEKGGKKGPKKGGKKGGKKGSMDKEDMQMMDTKDKKLATNVPLADEMGTLNQPQDFLAPNPPAQVNDEMDEMESA